ncbi:MAG: hypothetical protein V4557_12720 [Bacteroidota bacterium]
MNKFINAIIAVFILLSAGCKKENVYQSDNNSTVIVVNGVSSNPTFSLLLSMNGKLNPSGMTGTSSISSVNYGTGAFYFCPKASNQIGVLKGTDSTSLLSATYDLSGNSFYSLFIAGQAPNVEAVLVKEINYPYIRQDFIATAADSVIRIRFINLSPNAAPLNFRITGSTNNEATGIAYKGYTDFVSYPAKIANTSYKFDVVEGTTVLTTFTLSVTGTNRFKNVAILVRGLKGGTPALGVSTVNYF